MRRAVDIDQESRPLTTCHAALPPYPESWMTLSNSLDLFQKTELAKSSLPGRLQANQEDIVGYSARYGDKEATFVQLDREQAAKRKFVPKELRDVMFPGIA